MISVESLNTTNVEFTPIKSQHYHYLFIYLAVLADVFCILACATALACVGVRCRRIRFKTPTVLHYRTSDIASPEAPDDTDGDENDIEHVSKSEEHTEL